MRRAKKFEAILAGVTGPTNHNASAFVLEIIDPIPSWKGPTICDRREKLGRLRTLNGQTGPFGPFITKHHAIYHVFAKPSDIFLHTRGIHHEEEISLAKTIENQIIDHSPFFH